MLMRRGAGERKGSKSTPTTLKKEPMCRGSVGNDLDQLARERAIHTDPEETRRRRTIKLEKVNNTWGFTLQTYGIKNKQTRELDVMTYVDYVELHSPAGMAGMRRGDVLLSVNGDSVEGAPHSTLVDKIKSCEKVLRLVVLFEDCCRKVELYERFIKLKQVLKMKLEEYRYLEKKEYNILEGCGGFSRFSSVRSSIKSSASSDWDRFSMISPASMLTPNHLMPPHFLFPSRCASSVDDTSELSLEGATNDSFSDDNEAFLTSSTSCSDITSLQGLRRNKLDSASNKSISSLTSGNQSFDDDTLVRQAQPITDKISSTSSRDSHLNKVTSSLTNGIQRCSSDTLLLHTQPIADEVNMTSMRNSASTKSIGSLTSGNQICSSDTLFLQNQPNKDEISSTSSRDSSSNKSSGSLKSGNQSCSSDTLFLHNQPITDEISSTSSRDSASNKSTSSLTNGNQSCSNDTLLLQAQSIADGIGAAPIRDYLIVPEIVVEDENDVTWDNGSDCMPGQSPDLPCIEESKAVMDVTEVRPGGDNSAGEFSDSEIPDEIDTSQIKDISDHKFVKGMLVNNNDHVTKL